MCNGSALIYKITFPFHLRNPTFSKRQHIIKIFNEKSFLVIIIQPPL